MRECPSCGGCYQDFVLSCPIDEQPTESVIEGATLIDGKYHLERCMGRGGMGAVYQARHLKLNRLFALKLILPQQTTDPQFLRHFRTEAEALGRLRHRNIVEVTDYGIDPRGQGIPYLVMVYLEGRNLGQLLGERGTLPVEEALPLLGAMAEAVDFAHGKGILHLDLKPANVFLSRESSGQTVVKILDFGLARMMDSRKPETTDAGQSLPQISSKEPPADEGETRPLWQQPEIRSVQSVDDASLLERMAFDVIGQSVSACMGTPGYMAQEIIQGNRTSRAVDVYSFGIIAYEMLVGCKPFRGTMQEMLRDQAHEAPPRPTELNPAFPEDLNAALLAPLDRNPAQRPPNLKAVVAGIREAAARYRIRAWELRERPRRKFLAAALGFLVFGTVWGLHGVGPFRNLDHRQADLAFGWMPARPTDPRIVLVTLGESTLDEGSEYFFQQADNLTGRLGSILDSGVAGLAVDMLLPRRFSESQSLSKLVLTHQDRIVLALHLQEEGTPRGWDCLTDLTRAGLGSQERFEQVFGLVNFTPDEDGRIRSLQTSNPSQTGHFLEPMSVRLFHRLSSAAAKNIPNPLHIDFSVDPRNFSQIDWAKVPEALNADPSFFKGKFVLVGVESASKEDVHAIPAIQGRAPEVSGIRIHALLLQTLLENRSTRYLPAWLSALLAGPLAAFAAWKLLWERRIWQGLALAVASAAAGVALASGLWLAGYFIAISGIISGLSSVVVISLLLRRFMPSRPDAARSESGLPITSPAH